MLRILAKMGKRKAEKENPTSSTSSQPSSRKKGVGKGVSNIKHVYRNNEKQETQAVTFPRTSNTAGTVFINIKLGNKLQVYWRIC